MGPNERELSLSTDGCISDDARRQARSLDASLPKVARLRVAKVAPKASTIVERMVRVITDVVPKRATIHELDFTQAGISQADAKRHFVEAMNMARLREPAIDGVQKEAA